MTEHAFASATALTGAIANKKIGCRELLDHFVERVERLDGPINAVVVRDIERARQRADAADTALAKGEVWGKLHGLPMTVKEAYEVEGLATTSGAPKLKDHVSTRDAVAVARLRAAGAVIYGKTNVPIWTGDLQTYNEIYGTTNNPWDVSRAPGGSSGGAAALAAGFTPLELGSDIGGSIRNPAHYCGVFGHKPSHNIIPLRGHIPGPPGQLSIVDIAVAGPMARDAGDLALALDVMAGHDDWAGVGWTLDLPPPRRKSLKAYKIAAWLDDPFCPTDGESLEVIAAAIEALREAGAQVDETARPAFTLEECYRVYRRLLDPILAAGFSQRQFDDAARFAADLGDDDRDLRGEFLFNATQYHRDWLRANEERQRLRAAWAEFFTSHDVLLCPIMPTAAIPHDHSEPFLDRTVTVNGKPFPYTRQLAWAGLVSAYLLPATVAPVGLTASGLPVGLQAVAGYLEDRTAIDVAGRIAEVTGGFRAPPGYE